MRSETLTQALSIDYLLPVNAAAASYNSAAPIDMSKSTRAFYVLSVGVMGVSATVDARLQASATSGGTFSNVANTNIAQIVNTAPNTIVTIELRADQLNVAGANTVLNNTLKAVRLNCTVGTNAAFLSAVGLGGDSVQKPNSANNPAAVTQSVVCTL